jgi:hypothetical protein
MNPDDQRARSVPGDTESSPAEKPAERASWWRSTRNRVLAGASAVCVAALAGIIVSVVSATKARPAIRDSSGRWNPY